MFSYRKHIEIPKIKKHLRESFGLREYRNDVLDIKINDASKRINQYLKSLYTSNLSKQFIKPEFNKFIESNASLEIYNIKYDCFYFPLYISDCFDWLNTLNIIVYTDKNYKDELDVFVLCDTYTYQNTYNLNTGRNEQKLFSSNIKLKYMNKEITYFKKNDIATIVFKIPYHNIIDAFELECIIHHELSHISDLQINDIPDIYNDIIQKSKFNLSNEFVKEIQLLSDINVSYEDKIKIINEKNKSDLLTDFIFSYIYYLNISEIKAHLSNFKYDLKYSDLPVIYKYIHRRTDKTLLENYDDALMQVSNTYALYKNLFIVFKIFLKLMNKNEFREFKNNVIELFNENPDEYKDVLGDFIYDIDFSKYDGDYILTMFSNRINKLFIKNAINIAVDILSPDDKISLYTIMDRLKMKKENR